MDILFMIVGAGVAAYACLGAYRFWSKKKADEKANEGKPPDDVYPMW